VPLYYLGMNPLPGRERSQAGIRGRMGCVQNFASREFGVAGVSAGSALHLQSNARMNGIYAARVVGRNGDVRIGGDSEWQPFRSGYRNYRESADGAGRWVGLPGNPGLQQVPFRAALPIPDYTEPGSFNISDDLLN
jgi:hypothetical protein